MTEQRQGEIEARGRQVVELFTACATAPDDLDVARAADEALGGLETLLRANDHEGEEG